ncbi:MAG: hypothetical protein KJO04_04820, partial [Bacteroidia bacterium]|nr:hypothetical protein [Bacteroidia bacterium]
MKSFRPKSTLLFPVAVFCLLSTAYTQAPQIFSVEDFDLKGPVKSCTVITSYGKEEFSFDKQGRLTKLKTLHSTTDYDITYYIYEGDFIKERRNEIYRDKEFDRGTSMAHIYTIDTSETKRITESIISYAKVSLAQYDYIYNDQDLLFKIIRTDNSGVDETRIERDTTDGRITEQYYLNDQLVKIQSDWSDIENGQTLSKLMTVTMDRDKPQYRHTIARDTTGNIVKNSEWSELSGVDKEGRTVSKKQFTVDVNEYDENGMLLKRIRKKGKASEEDIFFHQLDGSAYGNWIKQVITPDNTYT